MIQRIQSLWLALAAVVAGVLFFLPIGVFTNNSVENTHDITLYLYNVLDITSNSSFPRFYTLPLLILNSVMLVLPVYTMLRYKKREHQLFMVRLSVFVEIAFIALLYAYYWSKLESVAGVHGDVRIGIFLPIVECILLLLAMNGIKKDIELVRSVDRIR